ncbi:MAG: 50S ribosomal protein L16 [Elusimicrobia bacterium RIFCSPLOWO2_12_FULL_59_9]|nr:MAG: 50S ribosomal protein L16 [Elusimicrobia bacterium RIFCSPLOWO2_12_FULL_59_9]
MLMPKRVKYRKPHTKRIRGSAKRGARLAFGEHGLKALGSAYITARQIEASRVAIGRYLKKGGKLWLRIFPDHAITKKPAETRMGKGKGAPEVWAARVKKGRVLFELDGIPVEMAREAFSRANAKLPIPTKFISRGARQAV